MQMRKGMWGLAAAAAMLMLGAGQAQATPLGVILQPEPDIAFAFGSVNYNAGTDTLTVSVISGGVTNMDAFGSPNTPIASGSLTLSSNVDGSGNLISGIFTVSGTIAAFGFNSGTLLTGNLTAIGFPNGSAGALEFLFDATGGDAQSLYGSNGAMVIGITNGFPGNWNSSFSASFSAPGDIATVIPEPGTVALLGLGLVGLAWQRRRAA